MSDHQRPRDIDSELERLERLDGALALARDDMERALAGARAARRGIVGDVLFTGALAAIAAYLWPTLTSPMPTPIMAMSAPVD